MPDSVNVGQTVVFVNNSFGQNEGTLFVWQINDLTSNGYLLKDTIINKQQTNVTNPISHTYLHEGMYQVSLSASGWGTVTKSIKVKSLINVSCAQYVAAYSYPNCEYVTNGSFEDYTALGVSTYSPSVQYACPWDYSAGPYSMGSADHYHQDNPNIILDVPTSKVGFQNPSEGKGYIGFASHFLNGTREYFHAPLKQPLQGGAAYNVSFKVSLAEGSSRATRVSACLVSALNSSQYTQNFPAITSNNIITINPNKCVTSNVVTDMNGWTTVSGTITADAVLPESKIIIGQFNFLGQPSPVPTVVTPNAQYPYFMTVSSGGAYYFVDEVSVKPDAYCHCITTKSFGTNLNSVTYTSQLGLLPGQSASIVGRLIVNSPSFTLSNINLKFAPGSRLEVPVGTKLNIANGTVLEACTEMWEGVFCDGEILAINSTVRDAKSALNFTKTAKWNLQYNTLENNRRHIYINGGPAAYAGFGGMFIKGNTLRCNPSQMKAPYANQYTENAIEIWNVRTINIGMIAPLGDRNTISDAFRGIYAKNAANLYVYNNHFQNIRCHLPAGSVCGKGIIPYVGIYVDQPKLTDEYSKVFVGEVDNTQAKNTFMDCEGGVYLMGNIQANVHNNQFNLINTYGIYGSGNSRSGNAILAFQNAIYNAKTGVYVQNHGNSPVWLIFNTVVKQNAYNSVPTYGIRVENALLPSVPSKVFISSNTLTRYRYGIYLNQTNRPYVNANTVNTHAGITSYPEGIRVDNSGAGTISENNIWEQSAGGQSIGIRVEYSAGMTTICNNIHANHISMFFGGTQLASTVGANYMYDGRTGVYINYGNIGPQGQGKDPHMNAWIGNTWNSHLHNYASSITGHGDNSQFNLKYFGTIFWPVPLIRTKNLGGNWPLISTMQVQNDNPIPTFVTNCRGNLDNPDGLVEQLFTDSASLGDSLLFREEIEWYRDLNLYRAVKEDTTGLLDASLYQYKADIEFTVTGRLDASKDSALAGNFIYAENTIGAVSTDKEIEQKLKEVYAGTFTFLADTSEDKRLAESDSLLLYQLAAECPYRFGEAVYTARNVLMAVNPDTLFINTCEDVDWMLEKSGSPSFSDQSHTLARVYPNPSADDFVVKLAGISEAEDTEVLVTDTHGRERGRYYIYRGADMVLIPGIGLEPGVYICTIKINGQTVETLKITKQ